MEEKLLQQILEELQKGGGSSGGQVKWNSTDLDTFAKGLKDNIDALKKAQPGYKSFQNFLDGAKTSKDTFDGLRQQLEQFDEELEKATKATQESADAEGKAEAVKQVSAINAQKRELSSAAAAKASKAALGNLAIGAGEVVASMSQGAMDFIASLQSGASGAEIATEAAKNLAGSASKGAQEVAGLGSSMGMIATMIGGPWVKAIGAAIEVVSMLVDFFAKKGGKAAEEAAQLLGKELQKTEKGFKDINSAGALFGGGMTEMRKEAARAGLDIASLANAVKASKDDLLGMGLGLGEATKRLAGVSKELRNNPVGMELRKLGYTAEEQAELSASVMANMNAAGDARIVNEKAVAEQTGKYGQDLRVLADLTGQDAKKALEKAREQTMEADLLAEAQLKGGAEGQLKLQRQLAAMPEGMKKGYMEFVSSQGKVITDVGTNVAMQQNPKILEQYKGMYSDLGDAKKDASAAQDATTKYTEKTAQYQRDHLEEQRSMGQAVRLASGSVGEGVRGAQTIANSLIQVNTKLKDGATDASRKAGKDAASNMAPLDKSVAELNDNTDKLRSALGENLTGPVTDFAKVSAKGVKTIDEALKEFGVKHKSSIQESNEAVAKLGNRGRGATPAGTTAPSGTPPSSGAAGGESKGTAPTAGSIPAPAPSVTSGRGSGMGGGTSRMKTGSLADGLTSKKTTTAAEGSGGADTKLPSGTGGADWLMGMIKNHEGMSLEPYKDSLGKWTVGIGHLIGDGSSLPDAWNKKFSESEVMDLFKKDFDVHQAAASLIPGFSKLGEKAQGALTDMTFNMGPSWYNKWPNLMESLGKGDISGAVANLASSKWATQVGKRSLDDINLLKDTKVSAKEGGFTDGPDGGYNATLHGKEAIIPLSGGKTVPVTMDMSMLIHKFDEMIKVLKSQHATSEKILRVSA